MVSKGFPNVTTSGRQYNIGEKPSVLVYTYINFHAGTPKPQSLSSKSPGLQCSNMVLYDLREVKGAPRVWAEKIYFGHKILMKQPHDCSYTSQWEGGQMELH